MDSNGSNFGSNTGASSFVEVPVLIKKAFASSMTPPAFSSYMAVGGIPPPGVHGGSSDGSCLMNIDSRRVFLNEIAIAAQLSYDCNVLKLCGIVRKGLQSFSLFPANESRDVIIASHGKTPNFITNEYYDVICINQFPTASVWQKQVKLLKKE